MQKHQINNKEFPSLKISNLISISTASGLHISNFSLKTATKSKTIHPFSQIEQSFMIPRQNASRRNKFTLLIPFAYRTFIILLHLLFPHLLLRVISKLLCPSFSHPILFISDLFFPIVFFLRQISRFLFVKFACYLLGNQMQIFFTEDEFF